MKQNFKVLIWILSIAGIALIILSAFSGDQSTKWNLFYTSAGLAVAVVVCYALYTKKPSAFKNKSNIQ
jgi:hypothetical protein